jgi:hypothetical protein
VAGTAASGCFVLVPLWSHATTRPSRDALRPHCDDNLTRNGFAKEHPLASSCRLDAARHIPLPSSHWERVQSDMSPRLVAFGSAGVQSWRWVVRSTTESPHLLSTAVIRATGWRGQSCSRSQRPVVTTSLPLKVPSSIVWWASTISSKRKT